MHNLNKLKYYHFLNRVYLLGSVRIKKILSICPDLDSFLELSRKDFTKITGVDNKISGELVKAREELKNYEEEFEKILELCEKNSIRIITSEDSEYPENLKNIYNNPVLLYIKGKLQKEDKYSFAIVGTRYPTEQGKLITRKLAEELSVLKLPVISGFARGIDTIAHTISLRSNNLTYAVFGCGLDVIYPADNKKLYDEMTEKAALISEYPPGTQPDRMNFPERNRIISGISLGTIVVESGLKGGSLLTADFALEQNREVFAIPGSIRAAQSQGTNDLIKTGKAKLITKIDDVVVELENRLNSYLTKTGSESPNFDFSSLKENEMKIYSVIDHEPVNIDHINQQTGLTISDCLVNLLSLEFKGLVKQVPGKNFIKV